ncbi:thiamine pyrophosphate-dependent enzyme, partial [Escherichia coli]|uniref:thiamine pyrophosphate-dependent enzyme n=1 Tax=Escherichia coli TaxID=562 RepID=UPI003EE21200
TADRNRSHWSTSKTPSYTKSVSWQHHQVAEGLGCKAIRVFKPEDIAPAFEQAKALMAQYRVPVVVEVILERVTNISMGSELDNVMEFEDIADNAADAPTETCFMHYE